MVETPAFLRAADPVLDEEERANLVVFVATNPEAGDVIPQTGGVRKLRWAAKGRGKRGGVRVIYYFHSESVSVFLLDVYAKNVKENMTKAERNALRKRIPLLVEEQKRRIR